MLNAATLNIVTRWLNYVLAIPFIILGIVGAKLPCFVGKVTRRDNHRNCGNHVFMVSVWVYSIQMTLLVVNIIICYI